jgi:uncharacterized membrane protein YGL010W
MYLPDDIAEVVTRLTFCFVDGLGLVLALLLFTYIPTMSFDTTVSLWLQIMVGAFAIFFVYRYLALGLYAVGNLRKFEIKINEITRATTYGHLEQLLE